MWSRGMAGGEAGPDTESSQGNSAAVLVVMMDGKRDTGQIWNGVLLAEYLVCRADPDRRAAERMEHLGAVEMICVTMADQDRPDVPRSKPIRWIESTTR